MTTPPQTPPPPQAGETAPSMENTAVPAVAEQAMKLDEFDNAATNDKAGQEDNGAIADNSSAKTSQKGASGLEALYDIPVSITVVLGRTHIEVADLLALDKGDIVELDRKVGEAIDIFVNNRLVARGEIVLVNERLGITMTEIIKSSQSG